MDFCPKSCRTVCTVGRTLGYLSAPQYEARNGSSSGYACRHQCIGTQGRPPIRPINGLAVNTAPRVAEQAACREGPEQDAPCRGGDQMVEGNFKPLVSKVALHSMHSHRQETGMSAYAGSSVNLGFSPISSPLASPSPVGFFSTFSTLSLNADRGLMPCACMHIARICTCANTSRFASFPTHMWRSHASSTHGLSTRMPTHVSSARGDPFFWKPIARHARPHALGTARPYTTLTHQAICTGDPQGHIR